MASVSSLNARTTNAQNKRITKAKEPKLESTKWLLWLVNDTTNYYYGSLLALRRMCLVVWPLCSVSLSACLAVFAKMADFSNPKDLLDMLMGKDRNATAADRDRPRRKEHFSDDEFCKDYIAGCCPHELFPNTKCDLGMCRVSRVSSSYPLNLGPCPKVHDEDMRDEYVL